MTERLAVYRVLCIDGGGIRGLVPALVLAELEERAQRPIAELFDLVAGTSAGAILGLALLRPGVGTRPHWSAREMAVFYETRSPRNFARSPWRVLRTVNGTIGPKYAVRNLEHQLHELFGDTMLSSALCDVVVPAYDLSSRRPYLFTSADVRAGEIPDQPMRVVARCTSAAPTYFAPAPLHDGAAEERWLVDGGVVASNPAISGYVAARQLEPADDLVLVSLGCGSLSLDYGTPWMRGAGALLWAHPLFNIVLDGQEDVTDSQLRQLIAKGSYYRFQPILQGRSERIDDTSPGNLRALRDVTMQLIERRGDDLESVLELLANDPQNAKVQQKARR